MNLRLSKTVCIHICFGIVINADPANFFTLSEHYIKQGKLPWSDFPRTQECRTHQHCAYYTMLAFAFYHTELFVHSNVKVEALFSIF